MSYPESVRLRQDDEDIADEMTREGIPGAQGSPCAMLRTSTQTTYPTSVNRFYHCEIMILSGTETEGGSATVDGSGKFVKAYNAGSAIPPTGTDVFGRFVGYRWVFRFP
jgi:hypothetical protein